MAFLKTKSNDNLTEKMQALSVAELSANLDHPARMVRAFVLREYALRSVNDPVLREIIKNELLKDLNRRTSLRGFVTVTLFVLGELFQKSESEALRILNLLDASEHRDFTEYVGDAAKKSSLNFA